MLLKEMCVPAQLNRPWGGSITGHVASVFSDQAQNDGEIGTGQCSRNLGWEKGDGSEKRMFSG